MTVLLSAEKVARAPYLKVAHCDFEARAELCIFLYRFKPLCGNFGKAFVAPERKICKSAP